VIDWGNDGKGILARYNADGTLDMSFDGDGKVITILDGMSGLYFGSGIVQKDGKIVVVGVVYTQDYGSNSFVVLRYNSDGSLDTSFDTDGVVITPINGSDRAQSVVQQSDGKLLVAGTSYKGVNGDIVLVRYNTDGSIDNRVITDLGGNDQLGSSDVGGGVAVLPGGKILVVGRSDGNIALLRYQSDLSLDTSFSGDGKVIVDSGGNVQPYGLAVLPDGKILVSGCSDTDVTLLRFNSDGTFDSTFAGNGKVIANIGLANGGFFSGAMTLQADGKILVSGQSNGDFALMRLNSDGKLDTAFHGDGKLTTDFGGEEYGQNIIVQSDGKILVVGSSSLILAGMAFKSDFAIARYNSDGTLDTTFHGDGKLTTDFGASDDYADSVLLQSDGKILVAGSSVKSDGSSDFELARYKSDGSLDSTFDGDGRLVMDFGGTLDTWYSISLQSDGKILVAGTSALSNNSDFLVARINQDGTLDATLGNASPNTPVYMPNGGSVVLNSFLQINDAELSTIGNFAGATLTLVRHGGANPEDLFSNTGTLGALTEGGGFVVGSTTIGAVTTNSGGILAVVFNTNATQSLVNSALPQFAYSNTSQASAGSLQIDWIFSDGNVGSQGSGGALSITGSTSVQLDSDTTPPTVTSFSPVDGVLGVTVDRDIVLTFSEAIQRGSGTIVIHSGSATGTVVASYDVATSTNLTIAGNMLTINPTVNLENSTHYSVTLDAGSVNDLAWNHYAGSTYNFTTDGPIIEVQTLFTDEFNSALNPADWDYNHWQANNNPSFYGRTQQRQELPGVSDGLLHLKLDTFNPTYNPTDPQQVPSFYGSEAITTQTFSNNTGGIVFEINAHLVNQTTGLVGGLFTNSTNAGTLHDEIDFEAVSNQPDKIQTNIYANEPLGAGHPQFNPLSGTLTDPHIYRIEWFKNAVRWIVDGQLVRVETTNIPQQPMALHLNIWAPGNEWIEGFSDALNPVTDPGANTSYYFDIDSVRVAQLSSTVVDITSPEVITFTPADAATGVTVESNIVIVFNEAIQKGTGLIEIHSGSATGTVVESYDAATSLNLTIAGNTLTINPTTALAYGGYYFVTVGYGNVKDLAGNNFSGTSTYDFTTQDSHTLKGGATFWNTSAPIADITSTLTTVPAATGTQLVEFRNILVAADGSRTLEIWETSPKSDIGTVRLEFSLSAGSVATWQSSTSLPSGWKFLGNTDTFGNFLLGGYGATALSVGPVKLGTLSLTAPTNLQHVGLSLTSGLLGTEIIAAFSIVSDSMTTGTDGLFQHIDMPDGTYALTSAKVSGMAESNAVKTHDALAALKIAVGMNPNADGRAVSPYQYLAADSNKDGQVRASDALNILKMAVKLDTAPASEWLFVPESVGSETMSRTNVVWPVNPTPVTLATDLDVHLIGIVRGDVDGSWAA